MWLFQMIRKERKQQAKRLSSADSDPSIPNKGSQSFDHIHLLGSDVSVRFCVSVILRYKDKTREVSKDSYHTFNLNHSTDSSTCMLLLAVRNKLHPFVNSCWNEEVQTIITHFHKPMDFYKKKRNCFEYLEIITFIILWINWKNPYNINSLLFSWANFACLLI